MNGGAQLKWYMAGQASWFISLGLQFVLFPFLVTNVLHETPARVGIAQMSLMIPSLVFMLYGGVIADRRDGRKILLLVHVLAALPPLALGLTIASGTMSYETLIIYALAMGTLGAFAIPARDAALTRVAGENVQKAVTIAMGTQLSAQLIGMLLAAATEFSGPAPLLYLQMAIMLAGGLSVYRLMAMPPHTKTTVRTHPLADILDGFKAAYATPGVLTVVGLMFGVGCFYVGSFLVVLPIMVRDVYQGGALEFSIVNACFWGGTILTTLTIMRTGHIARRGRAMMCALMSGAVVLVVLSFPVPFPVLCVLTFIWGLGAGTTMTMSRTIVQSSAPASHRARILSLFQLGFSGGTPIGALLIGQLVGRLGLYNAVLAPAAAMMFVLALVSVVTNFWRRHDPVPE